MILTSIIRSKTLESTQVLNAPILNIFFKFFFLNKSEGLSTEIFRQSNYVYTINPTAEIIVHFSLPNIKVFYPLWHLEIKIRQTWSRSSLYCTFVYPKIQLQVLKLKGHPIEKNVTFIHFPLFFIVAYFKDLTMTFWKLLILSAFKFSESYDLIKILS